MNLWEYELSPTTKLHSSERHVLEYMWRKQYLARSFYQ